MAMNVKSLVYTMLSVGLAMHVAASYAGGSAAPDNQAQDAGDGKAGARPIPKRAIEACNSKAEGDACSISTPKMGNIDGTCRKPPRAQGQVICVPNPLPQQFDACKGKAEGDACTFTGRKNNTVNGNCRKRPKVSDQLMCAHPKEGMDGHDGAGAPGENPPPVGQ